MTGPERYRKAEEALASLPTSVAGGAFERALLDEAQVHATLALAAASAANIRRNGALGDAMPEVADEWLAVLR